MLGRGARRQDVRRAVAHSGTPAVRALGAVLGWRTVKAASRAAASETWRRWRMLRRGTGRSAQMGGRRAGASGRVARMGAFRADAAARAWWLECGGLGRRLDVRGGPGPVRTPRQKGDMAVCVRCGFAAPELATRAQAAGHSGRRRQG